MRTFLDSFLENFATFIVGTAILGVVVWAAFDKGKGTTNEIWGLFGRTRKHVIGWSTYLCIAVAVSGAGAYSAVAEGPSQPSDVVGREYMIGSAVGDLEITRRLAIRDLARHSTSDIMSLHFIDETRVKLLYLGKAYEGHYSGDGRNGSVRIEVGAPAFPEGLSGKYESYGRRWVIGETAPGLGPRRPVMDGPLSSKLTLYSETFTYLLYDDREGASPKLPVVEAPEPPVPPPPDPPLLKPRRSK